MLFGYTRLLATAHSYFPSKIPPFKQFYAPEKASSYQNSRVNENTRKEEESQDTVTLPDTESKLCQAMKYARMYNIPQNVWPTWNC